MMNEGCMYIVLPGKKSHFDVVVGPGFVSIMCFKEPELIVSGLILTPPPPSRVTQDFYRG